MGPSENATVSTFSASDPDGYDHMMGRWSRILASPFIEFAGLDPSRSTLDVGCGTGSFASVLASLGDGPITGVDLAEPYLARAAERMPGPRFDFRVANACDLPFPDEAFDQCASLLVLQFIPNAPAALVEMRRVTRLGGTAAAAVWDVRGGMVFNRLFLDTAAVIDPAADEMRRSNYTRPLTRPGELGEAFRAAGFRDVREDMLVIRMTYENFAAYWAPADGDEGPWADYAKAASPETLTKVKKAVRRAYLDGEGDGPRSYACVAWAAVGKA